MVGSKASVRATVVVPTHRRPAALTRCLVALRGQSIWPELEVIVVHDGPAGPDLASDDVRVVETDVRRGPASARNAGARLARAPFVLFTDDDCIPSADWAERLVALLAGGAEVAAGRTTSEANALDRASQVIADELMTHGGTGTSLAFAPTLNLGCRKEVLEQIPFDERFPAAAGEDRAWCLEVRDRGLAIVAAPDARVDHRPELTLGRFLGQHVRYGRGSRRFRSRYRQRVAAPSFYLGLVRHGFAAGPVVGALVLVAQVATAAGIAREAVVSR